MKTKRALVVARILATQKAKRRGWTPSKGPWDRKKPHKASGGEVDDWITPSAAGKDDWITPAAPKATSAEPVSEDKGMMHALGHGAAAGATFNFSDELSGLSAAAPKINHPLIPKPLIGAARLGLNYFTGSDPESIKAYEKARDEERAAQKSAEEHHPIGYIGGQIAGAIPGMAVAPEAAIVKGAGMAANTGRAALGGLGYGAASGVGAGEDAADRATKGLVGGATGAAVGALASPAVDLIGKGVQKGVSAIRGLHDPEAEAARRVATALEKDRNVTGGFSLTPQEAAAARSAQQPVTIGDLGGESTRALARSAANTSTEARQTLQATIDPRYESQGYRASEFVRGLVSSPAEAEASKDALRQAGSAMNNHLYSAAKREFADGIPWTEDLAAVTKTPAVIDAMKAASVSMKNRVGSGRSDPAIVGPDNRVTLEAWDLIKRNLDGKIGEAKRSGNRSLVGELQGVRSELVRNLDEATINPQTGISSYQKARGAAAEIFKATDAIDAGEKFVSTKLSNAEARKAVNSMHSEERMAFAEGYASELVKKIHEVGYRRDVVNALFNSPAAKERAEIALGNDKAKELEMFFRTESVMDKMRGAMGNSTTARQLAEMGLAGGAFGLSTGDLSPSGLLKGALLFKGAKMAGKAAMANADGKVAQKVAEMLVSDDPSVLQKGIKLLNKRPTMTNNLRRFDAYLSRVGAQNAPSASLPRLQGPMPAAADQEQP